MKCDKQNMLLYAVTDRAWVGKQTLYELSLIHIYGDREKKLEILKDPHCGAFAVIRLCSYFLA